MATDVLTLASLPVPTHEPGEATARAREILGRPEFRPRPRGLTERVIGWVLERLGELIASLSGGGRGAVVAWALLVLGGVAIALVVRRAWRVRRIRMESESPLAGDEGRPPRDWEAEAEAHEAAGRHRDAIRCRYRAVIAGLSEAGLVEEIPGRTAREYAAEVRLSLPSSAGPFEGLTAQFERCWYGRLPVGPDDVDRFRRDVAAVSVAAQ